VKQLVREEKEQVLYRADLRLGLYIPSLQGSHSLSVLKASSVYRLPLEEEDSTKMLLQQEVGHLLYNHVHVVLQKSECYPYRQVDYMVEPVRYLAKSIFVSS
jgi:hypothetical protein